MKGTYTLIYCWFTAEIQKFDLWPRWPWPLKNEPLELISGAALHLPTKFGEDRPKDLGGTNRKKNHKFDLWPRWPLTQLDPYILIRDHSPSFMQIGPRTAEIQKFDLWPRWPWPLKNEPLELISGAALNLPTKFGEDRPKDLGEVGEQTEKTPHKFDLWPRWPWPFKKWTPQANIRDLPPPSLQIWRRSAQGPGRSRGTNKQTNKQTDKRCSNYSMIQQ